MKQSLLLVVLVCLWYASAFSHMRVYLEGKYEIRLSVTV